MWTTRPRTRRKSRQPSTPSCKGRDNRTWNRRRDSFRIIYSVILAACMATQEARCAKCPPPDTIPGCPCYNFENGGLFLECAGATEESLRNALSGVIHAAGDEGVLVQSLSVYELDRKVEELRSAAFPAGSQIRHLQISHSAIREISENAFERLSKSLESLALVSGRLAQVPQKAMGTLSLLKALDLEANLVQELPSFSFYGLSLIKLNLKGNQIMKISEYAFAGLEGTLKDLDLAENKIRLFPMTSLRRLEHLTSLRLAWNEVSQLPEDGYSRLDALNFLDLSSNNFKDIPLNCFRCCPSLKTLSLYYNAVESVDKDAFISLIDLESIDLSHNKIVFLDVATFRANQKLRSIDLSHNHIHYIRGVFSRLPELKELFLAENNILEIPAETFSGSTSLSVVYLQQNAIRRIDGRGLATLSQLAQLHLSGNYIEKVPRDFLEHCENLSTLSLDGNNIRELEVGTFAKAKQLRELRLQDNQITEVKRGVFAPLPSLLELHLQNNAITDMETGALRSLHSLQHVNLQGNLLAVLGDVFQISNDVGQSESSGSSLVSIQLDNNGLGVLHNDSLRGQASVRIMWLGHNRLTRLQAPLFRDLLLVERLYLTNNSISRIEDTAFKPMQALKFLELSMNRLSHVTVKTFSELHELEELYLQDNGLRRLDPYALTALKRLRVLDLANNHLNVLHDKIFQEGLPIRTLNLKNCTITVIENGAFRGLNNLYELNLEHNHFTATALDRLDIPGLRVLRISYNNFSQINGNSLDGLPSLQHLAMDSSQISRMPAEIFSKNKNLGKLLLSNNRLRVLPATLFLGLEVLKEVKLDGNRFQDAPYDVFANASTVEFLSLANNVLLQMDMSRLNGLISLRELDLRGNYIMSLTGFSTANFSRLISVDLSHNHLAALPANFFARSNMLRKIELAANKFRQIPAVALTAQNIPGLAWLNVTANPLVRIHEISSEAKYPALQEIHISGTNLTIVTSQDFEAFPALMHLFMGSNMISRVSPSAFRSLPNLLTLDLSVNELELLPQERLKGLEHLRLLNLTHNCLKELEDFPPDLKALQVLDLSYNQISGVGKSTFQHLENLAELHLYGNWISSISPDAFKPLKKLRILDLSRNYLANLPLNAFRPLETQIRSLRAEENPLHCDCESQELWEWLRDHQKLVGGGMSRNRGGGGLRVNDMDSGLLRCEQPPELRGLVFLDLDPHAFCSAPLVLKLAIQDIQPFSVLVSWQSRNHSGLRGYQVAYHALDNVDEVRAKILEPSVRSVKLSKLSSNTRYLICVFGLGNWMTPSVENNPSAEQLNFSQTEILASTPSSQMTDSSTSRCTEVKTLDVPDAIISSDGSAMGDVGSVSSFLTRRLGLIVGCCMGFVVFLLLVSVLGYLKVKKQREAVKREQQPIPPEYISYRHFSIQSGEAGHTAAKQTSIQDGQHPSFIGSMGNTTLNV
ncbi:protein artichoke [Harpegnathos saltator]|uniref:protein artichoke n=1 Tax=Harpegnathos saltator TaxID=610380 RepID=UPI00058E4358|nr:protein artichoke [Harpegnathos saltator]XP_025160020.1 protein artichoke [Harpegnathos saltator]XP_025160021.1 protein artichoke [Harpegnathos saltator]XP_025160022.1 protein artichoke [Harpegnathos saltator]XP_025160023.1 protein artichoke [Harpegnathos saltator]XP_025160024.1 protein artichoke [Harpegnathos saltator]